MDYFKRFSALLPEALPSSFLAQDFLSIGAWFNLKSRAPRRCARMTIPEAHGVMTAH
jgi:hypothetical protein